MARYSGDLAVSMAGSGGRRCRRGPRPCHQVVLEMPCDRRLQFSLWRYQLDTVFLHHGRKAANLSAQSTKRPRTETSCGYITRPRSARAGRHKGLHSHSRAKVTLMAIGLTIGAHFAGSPAAAADVEGVYRIRGAGALTCGDWLSNRRLDRVSSGSVEAWVLGYMTAYNAWQHDGRAVAVGINNARLFSLLESECRRAPGNKIARALAHVISKLGSTQTIGPNQTESINDLSDVDSMRTLGEEGAYPASSSEAE